MYSNKVSRHSKWHLGYVAHGQRTEPQTGHAPNQIWAGDDYVWAQWAPNFEDSAIHLGALLVELVVANFLSSAQIS